jgi:hypothetical protein
MVRQSASACIGVLVGCCLLLVVEVAEALPESHSPFFPEEDYRLALGTCEPTSREIRRDHPAVGSVTFEARGGGETLTLRMSSSAQDPATRYVAHIEESGQRATPEVELPLVADVAWLLPGKAVCADLNGDGKTDFITDHWRHGNGLGGAFSDRLLVLSSPSGGYRFWILGTMYASAADYVSFGAIEPIVIVTTSFANSGGAIPHSYLVYDLWTVRGGEVVSANHIDDRFPKWVWMIVGENHKPASSLSREAKRRMRERGNSSWGPPVTEIRVP